MNSITFTKPLIGFLAATLVGIVGQQTLFLVVGLTGALATIGIQLSQAKYGEGLQEIATNVTSDNALSVRLAAGREVWVRGVNFRQSDLRRAGVGPVKVGLLPDPTNPKDPTAVKVVALGENGHHRHIGYLPGDTATTRVTAEYGAFLGKDGSWLECDGIIEEGDVGLVARIYPPDFSTISEIMIEIRREFAARNGTVIEFLTVDKVPPIVTAEFRKMDLINASEFNNVYQNLYPKLGQTVCWLTLVQRPDSSVAVHLCVGEKGIGPQVGRVAKKHLTYAQAVAFEGPIAGLGTLHCNLYGEVSITIGDPKWRGY